MARQWLAQATHVLVAAGAGMGVDSGLPDFRGPEGFWRHYPLFRSMGWTFEDAASPKAFRVAPAMAWGFYGHRLTLYRTTEPHEGFHRLRKATESQSVFVVTTNVDGQFQASGWPEPGVLEQHGSIHWLQCTIPCSDDVWPAADLTVALDDRGLWRGDFPRCRHCNAIARPNILMFSDAAWIGRRTEHQRERFRGWINNCGTDNLLVIEIGAGCAIPTLRRLSERLHGNGARLVRINPRDGQVPEGAISLPMGAREALTAWLDAGEI